MKQFHPSASQFSGRTPPKTATDSRQAQHGQTPPSMEADANESAADAKKPAASAETGLEPAHHDAATTQRQAQPGLRQQFREAGAPRSGQTARISSRASATAPVPPAAAFPAAVPLDEANPPPPSRKSGYWRKLGGGSLLVSALVHAIFLSVAVIWVVANIPPAPEKIVDFKPQGGGGAPSSPLPQQREQQNQQLASLSRVSAMNSLSSLVLPEPEISSDMPSLGSLGEGLSAAALAGGSSGDGGNGTGLGGSGIGSGLGGDSGLLAFFGRESRATRVAFVIDFSGSNSSEQRETVKREVERVLKSMREGCQYQIFGFAGSVWILGDSFEQVGGPRDSTPELRAQIVLGGRGREYRHVWQHRKNYAWEQDDANLPQNVPWISANTDNTAVSIEDMHSQRWVGGTNWEVALKMPLRMDPLPQEVYFLTDGNHASGNDHTAEEIAEDMGKQYYRRGVTLHCIALVSQEAADNLRPLAEKSRGDLSLASADGAAEVIEDFVTPEIAAQREQLHQQQARQGGLSGQGNRPMP